MACGGGGMGGARTPARALRTCPSCFLSLLHQGLPAPSTLPFWGSLATPPYPILFGVCHTQQPQLLWAPTPHPIPKPSGPV